MHQINLEPNIVESGRCLSDLPKAKKQQFVQKFENSSQLFEDGGEDERDARDDVPVAEGGAEVGQEVPEGRKLQVEAGQGGILLEAEEAAAEHLSQGQHQQAGRGAGGHQLHPASPGRPRTRHTERLRKKLLKNSRSRFSLPCIGHNSCS